MNMACSPCRHVEGAVAGLRSFAWSVHKVQEGVRPNPIPRGVGLLVAYCVAAVFLSIHAGAAFGQDDRNFERANRNIDAFLGQRQYGTVVFLGTGWVQTNTDEAVSWLKPLLGDNFDVFAFGMSTDSAVTAPLEILRVISAQVNRTVPATVHASRLEDAEIDTLVAHSNGCDEAVTRIKQRTIKKVRRLILFAPPFGTAEEAKRLTGVDELIIVRVKGDPIAHWTGKKLLAWGMVDHFDMNLGFFPYKEDDSDGFAGVVFSRSVGSGGSQPNVREVEISDETRCVLENPHWLLTYALNAAILGIMEWDAGAVEEYLSRIDELCPKPKDQQYRQKVKGILQKAIQGDVPKPQDSQGDAIRRKPVRSATDDSAGVEAGLVSAAMIASWMAAAATQSTQGAVGLEDLLPTEALRGTGAVVTTPRQTMLEEFNANAVDARAVDFRIN
ncbi:MAG: hypothetical protein ABIP48_15245, partial [Planctomycetota bacterium]